MTKVRQNLEIIGLLRQLKEEKRQATPEQQKQLVLYTGWGHTAQPFHPKPRGNWLKLQEEMRPLFTDDEWAAASFSTINAHYTSPEVIRWKWQVIERLGFKGGRILEPALGVGHYFGLMPEAIKAKSQLWGCELDLLTGAVAKQLYPSANIHIAHNHPSNDPIPSPEDVQVTRHLREAAGLLGIDLLGHVRPFESARGYLYFVTSGLKTAWQKLDALTKVGAFCFLAKRAFLCPSNHSNG